MMVFLILHILCFTLLVCCGFGFNNPVVVRDGITTITTTTTHQPGMLSMTSTSSSSKQDETLEEESIGSNFVDHEKIIYDSIPDFVMDDLQEHDGYQGRLYVSDIFDETSSTNNVDEDEEDDENEDIVHHDGNNLLDKSTDPLVNTLSQMRKELTSCPDIWRRVGNICPNHKAIIDEHCCDHDIDLTYLQMKEKVLKCGSMFMKNLGVKKGDRVAIFGENSGIWLCIDHGIQMAGGISVIRGADAPIDELRYIYKDSEASNVIVMQSPKLLEKFMKYNNNDEKTKKEEEGLQQVIDGTKKSGGSVLGLSHKSNSVKKVILMHKDKYTDDDIHKLSEQLGIKVYVFDNLMKLTKSLDYDSFPENKKDDLCTIVYTSGTTGRPKGVCLTHENLLHQTGLRFTETKSIDESEPIPGDVFLAILPIWHVTERAAELCVLARGCAIAHSTVPTLKNDLQKYKPHWLVLVPRVLEKVAQGIKTKLFDKSSAVRALVKLFTATGKVKAKQSKIAAGLVCGDKKPGRFQKFKARYIVRALSPINYIGRKLVWNKVKKGFGGRQKAVISGGSALSGSLESFYEVCGIPILVGYGLTETSPIIAYRRADSNLVAGGCVGKPIIDTEVRVVDPATCADDGERPSLPDGNVGVVLVRGPQVMKGYYKNEKKTREVIDKFGWFDTGDLGMINKVTGDLFIIGRQKDTIVLSNGENVEPEPIEEAILSNMIDQVMLTGQDDKELSAIVVLNPNGLVQEGVIDKEEGSRLQEASDIMADPTCSEEECTNNRIKLEEAAKSLRENKNLKQILKSDIQSSCAHFRQWEQVGNIYITLEPFCMANGLLTQSYKIKRDQILARYKEELEKL